MAGSRLFPIAHEADILTTRQAGRRMAEEMGFSAVEATMIATAISEVARNMLTFAGEGEVVLEETSRDGRRGLRVIARDAGPGIADPVRALEDGYSTGRGLGLGLPGARRLMDALDLSSEPGRGTTVTMVRWMGS
jgi:serine/threonine-protein kinase RsbT